jgi:hypothetical protein
MLVGQLRAPAGPSDAEQANGGASLQDDLVAPFPSGSHGSRWSRCGPKQIIRTVRDVMIEHRVPPPPSSQAPQHKEQARRDGPDGPGTRGTKGTPDAPGT